MSPTTFIGIDNGLQGAIAMIEGQDVRVWPMPIIKDKRAVYDEAGIINVLDEAYGGDTLIAIEQAQAMRRPGQTGGLVATFKHGVNYGLIRGIVAGFLLPYVTVSPRKWQKLMHAGISAKDTKAASIIAAKRLFPLVSLRRTEKCRKDSDGMADALLIAQWARLTYGKSLLGTDDDARSVS